MPCYWLACGFISKLMNKKITPIICILIPLVYGCSRPSVPANPQLYLLSESQIANFVTASSSLNNDGTYSISFLSTKKVPVLHGHTVALDNGWMLTFNGKDSRPQIIQFSQTTLELDTNDSDQEYGLAREIEYNSIFIVPNINGGHVYFGKADLKAGIFTSLGQFTLTNGSASADHSVKLIVIAPSTTQHFLSSTEPSTAHHTEGVSAN